MTELTLIMAMMKLVDVTEVEEKVTFIFDYSAEWIDHRLKWNPLEYGGISHIYVPQRSIWLPEVTIADAHEINYNGTAGFYTSTVCSVICQLDVFKFPFDKHECGVSVVFNTYFADEYVIKGDMEKTSRPIDQLGNGEWKVSFIGVSEAESTNENYGAITRFVATIQRNPGFYVALVMVPAYFINFLSIIALFLNIENVGEKITVGLTNIMAMTFILVILAADLPKTARIPLLAIYVIVGLVIVMTSIAVVLVIPFIRRYQNKNKKCEKKEMIKTRHEVKFFESDDAPRMAWISYNGTAGFYTSTVSSVICQLDVYKFPLDHHECGVSVLFHTYFPDEYVIKSEMDTLRKSFSQLGNGEWKVTYIGVKEEGVETANYGKIQKFVAKIQRNPGFYEALVMVPAFFINVLTIVALFINIENFAEKISVGLTNIMAMTFILVILAADLPKTSRIPLLAIYVIVGLVIVMTSIGAVLIIPFIRKFQKKDQEDPLKRTRLYNWLKLEHILMVVFQIANLVNFIILFI
uniref:Neur_chan_memb domain-containing protein n=2 Tax=Caenorhabditis tropicalis TaxID=1561998 RepID=A0A1I7TXM6_9PELO